MILPPACWRTTLGLVAALLCVAPVRAQDGTPLNEGGFTQLVDDLAGATSGAVGLADIDNDGDLDVLVSGTTENGPLANLYRFQGYALVPQERTPPLHRLQAPSTQTLPEVGGAYGHVGWTDFNRDGLVDFYFSGSTTAEPPYTPSGRLFLNTGEVRERYRAIDLRVVPHTYAGSADWADFDRDGDEDLLVTGVTGNAGDAGDGPYVTALFRNDSGPAPGPGRISTVRFTEVQTGLPGLGYGEATWVDVDADGDADVLLAGDTEDGLVLELYRNDDGVFARAWSAPDPLYYTRVDWADFDGDGDPDLLLSGARIEARLARGVTRVYRNDGGTLVDTGLDPAGTFAPGGLWGAFLGGRPDLFLLGVDALADPDGIRRVLMLKNGGAGLFTEDGATPFVAAALGAVAAGDLDGDLDLDLATLGYTTRPEAVVYRNEVGGNTAPAAPAGLRSEVDGGRVVLAWTAAEDAETPGPALTYNVRVGTAPGAGDVVAPLAEPATGRRRVPGAGNAGQAASRLLRDLPPGTYYWSVQAIDGADAASPFAPEQRFTLPE